MQIEKVLEIARPYLKGKKVQDAVIGVSLVAVELDCGYVGVSYVLRENLKGGCSIFPFGRAIIGEDAEKIANWAVMGADDLQRTVGMAVLTAASRALNLGNADTPNTPFGIKTLPTDKLGMIGFISPVVKIFSSKVKDFVIFDEGRFKDGEADGVFYPMQDQPKLLPECDIVVLSGTTLINQSFDELLSLCEKAREIVMIGASTPMFPEAFKETKVSVLAGSWWKSELKEDIFKYISLAAGIDFLSKYSIKKSAIVK